MARSKARPAFEPTADARSAMHEASHAQAIEFILQAIEQAGLQPGRDVGLALDVASSHFYHDGNYHLTSGGPRTDAYDWSVSVTPFCDH